MSDKKCIMCKEKATHYLEHNDFETEINNNDYFCTDCYVTELNVLIQEMEESN